MSSTFSRRSADNCHLEGPNQIELEPVAFQIFHTAKVLSPEASAILLKDQCVALWGFSWVVIRTISALVPL